MRGGIDRSGAELRAAHRACERLSKSPLPSPTNYVDLDPEVKDVFSIPALRFHFQWGRNELQMWEHAKSTVAELLKVVGGEIWEVGTEPEPPGTSLHETGVCRFGNDPKKFVTNRWAHG